MGTVFGGFRLYKPASDTVMDLPSAASTAISVGDLLFWDTTNKVLKPFDQYVATGTVNTDQAAIRAVFAGVALQGKLAADPSGGYPAFNGEAITFAPDALYEATCAAATFEPGDLVAASVTAAAGAGNVANQTLVKTTDSGEAIGYVVERYASNTTSVRVRLIGRWSPFNFADYNNTTSV
jgi:hypothetical protein